MSRELLETLTWLAPLPPLAAFAIIALFTHRHRQTSSTIAVGAMLISAVLAFIVFFNVIGLPDLGKNPLRQSIPWIPTGETALRLGILVDPLGATFLFMVPLTCSLIFIYSTGYMASDPLYSRFFAFLSLFGGSMMGLVVSDSLLALFIFWELMGFCSYSLIGFFYRKPSAYKAAVKAFMTTRVGDMLLLLGMVYLYSQTGTLSFFDVLHNEETLRLLAETPAVLGLGISAAGMIGILIFGGTVGKSAQFPLHVWLPDAMEGPTPVSAMIHAATMVSAGVFMLLRFFPLFQFAGHDSVAFTIVGVIGALTAFLGATIAVAQYDIKRVLAFSTISQLGFMVAAVGIGAYIAAGFHLLTHAFFKALLFLGSGSVIHGVEHGHHHTAHGHSHHSNPSHDGDHHSDTEAEHDDHHASAQTEHSESFDPQDMRNMGGLRHRMPVTFWTFLIGSLALIGFPFITAGFWSKDEIFADAFHAIGEGNTLAVVVFIVLVISATLTAFYTTRQVALTFFGEPRSAAAEHASESAPSMTVPLIVLSIFALFLGFINVPKDFPLFGALLGDGAYWLKNLLVSGLLEKEPTIPFNPIPVLFSLAVVAIGMGLGYAVYLRRPLQAGQTDPVEKLGGLFTFLHNRWYFDELYRAIFIRPMQWLADNYTRLVDKGLIDAVLEGGYRLGSVVAGWFKTFDRVVVTGISDFIGNTIRDIGREGRELQSGQVQNYLLSGLIAAVVLVVFFLVFSR
ncbi:MAG: NADH-quinone oxidoreductase subunit L [Anaerolineae bacterium]|nr:NADH-quinone oxidoreductase subunit L [Thermoflexales bacterium]MDW8407082.1 NADH-quinone oxidoreductase subunit L [Anaerolineae bacterium]